MNEVILAKLGEVVLKGLNRKNFEDTLIKTLRRRLHRIGSFQVRSAQSTITVTPLSPQEDMDAAEACVAHVFGIASYCRACAVEKDLEIIKQSAGDYVEELFCTIGSFKVESKRSDKKFPYTSPEISREVGSYLADRFPQVAVNVHSPDTVVTIEVRDEAAFIHADARRGAGGIPIGTGGKALTLISGGIDSPVASFMIAKRGIELTAVHFASPPYTSQRAEEKVEELLHRVAAYSGRIKLFVVPFTRLQEAIRDECREEYSTIVMRRFMMMIAVRLAEMEGCQALITGESLGQVASQTLGAVSCTDEVSPLPVFRPLIGMDKEEIIEIARRIDTFEVSIQPYEDCCTVFTPRHPRTRPVLSDVLAQQNKIEYQPMIEEAIAQVQVRMIY